MRTIRYKLTLPAALLLLSVMTLGVSECSNAQSDSNARVDYFVEVLLKTVDGKQKCATDPDTLYVSRRMIKGPAPVIAFLAGADDVTISELNQRPSLREPNGNGRDLPPTGRAGNRKIQRNPNGPPLSARERIEGLGMGQFERLELNADAFGTYQYNVQCGDIPDDPPAIIIDR